MPRQPTSSEEEPNMYGRAFIGDLLASVNLRFSSGESGMNLYEKEQELAKPTDNNNKIISSFFSPVFRKPS